MNVLSKSLEETNKAAQDFLNKLSPKDNSATIVGLFGDLGAGKTTFTQALAKNLGVTEVVTSPTFVIEKIYLLKDGEKPAESSLYLTKTNRSDSFPPVFERLIHIDAYRLDSGKELLSLQFAEIQKDPKNLILIEWPERVIDVLPADLIKINFKFINENEREIIF